MAVVSVGLVAAQDSLSSTSISKEAMAYIDQLTEEHKASRLLDGRGVKPHARGSTGDCSIGHVSCCNQVINDSQKKKTLAGLLGLDDVIGELALQCNNIPINVIGAAIDASSYCKSIPVVSFHVMLIS